MSASGADLEEGASHRHDECPAARDGAARPRRRRAARASPSGSPASWPTATSTSPSAAGTVHAIVGENGAGKSTLMKILYGMQRPDEGTIAVDGQPGRASTSPADAIAAGIGMVHQHFMLADNLTVLENIVLGSEPTQGRPCSTSARPGDGSSEISDALRPRRRPRRAGRGPRRRRPAAGGDPQGALPRRPDPDPRRADRRAGAAGGRRAVRQPARAEGRGPDGHLHLAQARRGARGRRRDHRHPARHHGRHRRPADVDRPAARRADGRQRAADARDPRVDGHRPRRCCSVAGPRPSRRRRPRRCSTTSRFTIHARRGARHRRRRGQRPGRAGRGDHGHARRRPRARSRSATTDITALAHPRAAARPASATSPRTGTGTACCSRRRCGRTASSATRPQRAQRHGAAASTGRRAQADTERIVDGVRRPHARHRRAAPRRCPAATSRS